MNILMPIIISYLIGSFPTCYLIIKKLTGKSIFEQGDGNMGGTNVFIITKSLLITSIAVIGDVMKGFLSAWLSTVLLNNKWLGVLIGGVFSIIGHNYSIFMKFKGGKGGACTLGALLYVNPLIPLLCLPWFLFVKTIKKFIQVNEFQEVIFRTILLPLIVYFFINADYTLHTLVFQILSIIKYLTNKEWNKEWFEAKFS